MDPALNRAINATMPKFTPELAEGFAVSQVPLAEAYVDMLFRAVSKSFPPDVKYHGGRRCTSKEEYQVITKPKTQKTQKKSHKSTYDIAPSNIRLMRYDFSFKDVMFKMPRYLYLPYVTDGGHIMISGSRYTVSPVLADRVISILEKSVFVRLIKSRFNVYRLLQHYLIDGQDFSIHVVHSKIYQKPKIKERGEDRAEAESTMPHYLFCKYGFTETFRQFANCNPVVGDQNSITTEKYPPSEWHIYSSMRTVTGKAPPEFPRQFYQASNIRVAVKKSERSPMVDKLLGGFFYVLDIFPDRIRPEYFDKQSETTMWIRLLGWIVAPGTSSDGKLLKEMDDHMRSLDEYIDAIVKDQLAKIGMPIDNVYQLFAILTEQFNDMLLKGATKLSSMYDKELNVNYFVLYDISKAIVELGFRMMKLAEKPDLTEKEVINAFTSLIKPGLIYNINKNVGSVSPNSYPGDNMALKITTLLVPQQSSNKKPKTHSSLQLSDPINRMHVSVAEIGGYANLPKSQPSGHYRLSLFARMSEDNVVQRDPRFVQLFDRIQRMFELP